MNNPLLKLIIFFLLLLLNKQFSSAQIYEIINREIAVKLEINKKNDTSIIIIRTLINKTSNDLYVSNMARNYQVREWVLDSLSIPIELGAYQIGITPEVAIHLQILKSKDTLKSEQFLFLKNISEKGKLIIDFDYLHPSKFNKRIKKKILKSLYYYPVKGKEQYLLDRLLYGYFCETMTLIIPFINQGK